MDRKIKEEMNELSKQVFGSASRWRKILDKGVVQPEVISKIVPNPETNKLEEKQFNTNNKTVFRYTLEQLRQVMESMVASRAYGSDFAPEEN